MGVSSLASAAMTEKEKKEVRQDVQKMAERWFRDGSWLSELP